MKNFRIKFIKIIIFLIDSIRPFLGPRNCCIHPVTCRQYAKTILQHKPLFLAIPLITIRLISCNPITALFWKIKTYFCR